MPLHIAKVDVQDGLIICAGNHGELLLTIPLAIARQAVMQIVMELMEQPTPATQPA